MLPDGTEYVSWEVPVTYSKTYYVDNGNPDASDKNEGTREQPFLTISKAAEVLQPGERVIINSGVYREQIRPLHGGSGADKLISYEAAPGAKVIVKGSVLASTDEWQHSSGYRIRTRTADNQPSVFKYNLECIDFKGYNPFGMANLMHDDRSYFPWNNREQIKPHFLRRGMIFVDGRKLKQVENASELSSDEYAFWVEEDGLTVHLRLSGNANPAEHDVEFTIHERVFAPKLQYLGYIRIKGIIFEHGASGLPIPQKGIVSTNRGNHWIIEDCVIRHANSVGLDIGEGTWIADRPIVPTGYTIVRRTHIYDAGVSGIAGIRAPYSLIESCLIENIGWQNVQRTFESAGIKLHYAKNNIIANCVIRDVVYGTGVWFDYECNNSRFTNNLIMNVNHVGIDMEASPKSGNMIDHNIIWNITNPGLTVDHIGNGINIAGSDEGIYAHNIIGMCDNFGIWITNMEGRIVAGSGGLSRWNNIENNLFYRCSNPINFAHKDNFADGNLYGISEGVGSIRNRILYPDNIQPDLRAWQRYFGFDKNGDYANVNIRINTDDMTMTWSSGGDIPSVATGTFYKVDFLHKTAGKNRKAGPFANFPVNNNTINIDPRINPNN